LLHDHVVVVAWLDRYRNRVLTPVLHRCDQMVVLVAERVAEHDQASGVRRKGLMCEREVVGAPDRPQLVLGVSFGDKQRALDVIELSRELVQYRTFFGPDLARSAVRKAPQ